MSEGSVWLVGNGKRWMVRWCRLCDAVWTEVLNEGEPAGAHVCGVPA